MADRNALFAEYDPEGVRRPEAHVALTVRPGRPEDVPTLARLAKARSGGDPANVMPEGWHLLGVVVDPAHRRLGLGRMLTEHRLAWLAKRADTAWYFASALNRATLDLHAKLGFVELTRDFSAPGCTFTGGVGVLCRVDLRSGAIRS